MRKTELGLEAVSGGIKYDLNGGRASGFYLVDPGLNMGQINRLTQRGPQQIGDTDVGYDYLANVATPIWELQSESGFTMWDLREKLISVFRPRVTDPTQLVWTFPNGRSLALDVNMSGIIEMTDGMRGDGWTQRAAVEARASDPRYYDPRRNEVRFVVGLVSQGWPVEETGNTTLLGWPIEETGQSTQDGWPIGLSEIDATQTVFYGEGKVSADIEFPVIRITGPIQNPIITNLTTNEKLDLSANGGLALGSGEFVEIDLRYRKGKKITNQNGDSVAQFLSDDSDLSSWHLSYNTELLDPDTGTRSDGNNVIRVQGQGATLSTVVTVLWYNRYLDI